MKKLRQHLLNIVLYFGVAILVFQISDFWRTKDIQNNIASAETVSSIHGKTVTLDSNEDGELWFLYFWATWCSPCKATTPSLKALAKNHKVVSVAMSSGSDQELRNYQAKAEIDFPIINDVNAGLAKKMNVAVTPTVLLMKGQRVVDKTVGISTYPGLMLRKFKAGIP